MKYNSILQSAIFLILILGLNSSGFSQNRSKEFVLKLNRGIEIISEEFPISKKSINPFIGVSAYCLNKDIEADLYYSIRVENKWQSWIPFQEYKVLV